MVQVLEKEEIYVIIPEIKEKAEKVKKRQKKTRKRIKTLKHSTRLQENINVNKTKNKVDSSMFGINFYNR